MAFHVTRFASVKCTKHAAYPQGTQHGLKHGYIGFDPRMPGLRVPDNTVNAELEDRHDRVLALLKIFCTFASVLGKAQGT